MERKTNVLIVGLGLMGGSYARALNDQGMNVGALDIDQKAVDYALQQGWIASGQTEVTPDYLAEFDLIVFALYPHTLFAWLKKYQQYLKPHALLTDVTGVKGCVVYRVQAMLRDDLEFIAAHPMAGRESSGVQYAKKEIFEGANYIVTPTEKNTKEAIERCKALGRLLGFARITELTPEKHDEMIGFLSQLTHCIAVSLMTCRETAHLIDYTGDSFRDLTRIAKINDEMWSELFLLNKDVLLEQMDLFEKQFHVLRDAIEAGDREKIREIMRQSTEQRKKFDIRQGE